MQKEIQLTDKTLLVVSVPKEASDLTLPKVGIADLYFRTDDKEYEDGYISVGIPQGYELLGIYPELTEEQIATLGLDLESFQSLMEREKCYTVNPYHKPTEDLSFYDQPSDYDICLAKYQKAQQTTFEKYAILIKIK